MISKVMHGLECKFHGEVGLKQLDTELFGFSMDL